ncbi:MAG: DUF4251 domain-containing protein [Bacteroidales bacterium]|nr:DUF4251 domain-containing protein [Bacteroidales bacterium]
MKSFTKTTILTLLIVMLSFTDYAQTPVASKAKHRKELRMKKKAEKARASLESRKYYAYLLKNRAFVLEATEFYGPRGVMMPVSPSTNFLAVRKNKLIFQFGLGAGGRNGVGGMTAEGFINHYEFDPGKNNNKALSVSGSIQPKGSGVRGFFTVTVMNSGVADLSISLPFSSGQIRMSGRIVSLPKAGVFKGQTDF